MKQNTLMILSSDSEVYLEILSRAALPGLSIEASQEMDGNSNYLGGCEIILGDPDIVSPALAHAHRLKWVQSTWAGITPFMAPELRQDYILTGVKGVFGQHMKEYVICHLLMHERKSIKRYHKQLKKEWDTTPPGTLEGKCIGIMGLGSIGGDIAQIVKTFGMKTRGFSRSRTSCDYIDHCFLPHELLDFVSDLDFLVSVLPDTSDTRGLINETVLQALPEKALIINVGRGNIFHEPSLIGALINGDIGGAVLDVFQEEPLSASHPLWDTPNTVITCHTSAMSFPEQIAPIFIENYHRFIRQDPLQYVVDFSRGY